MLRPFVTIGCLAAVTAAVAEPSPMTGKTIRETLAGAKIEIDTPAGTTIPVQISRKGLVSGEAGSLASYLGAAKDRGRWWVAGDHLCVKWFRWFEAKPNCISLRQDGRRLYWRDQTGETGTATIAEFAEPVKPPTPTYALGAGKTEEQKPVETKAAAVQPQAPALQRAGATLGGVELINAVEAAPATQEPLASVPARSATQAPASEAAAPDTNTPPASMQMANVPVPQRAPMRAAAQKPAARPARGSASEAVSVTFRVAGVADDDILNVRSGPSQYYPPVGGIPPHGRSVHITGPCRDSWCPIRHRSVRGWVNRYYLAQDTAGLAR